MTASNDSSKPGFAKPALVTGLIIGLIILIIAVAGTKFGFASHLWQTLIGVPVTQENYLINPSPARSSTPSSSSQTSTDTAPATGVTILAAGDIASCDNDNDRLTADLLKDQTALILALGDNVYNSGSASEFANCFNPTWGQYKSRLKPAVGNHEYLTSGASGYFGYFGASVGESGKGYYSFDSGQWHLISLNSNCGIVGCAANSGQAEWLKADLAAHKNTCVLAYMHHPRFSSGSTHGNDSAVEPLWQILYDNGADVVLSGHEHNYERFAPQTPSGSADAAKGIREFVVGTGGRSLYGFGAAKPNSEVRDNSSYGVLKMTLLDNSFYSWQFMPAAGYTFTDSGTTDCH